MARSRRPRPKNAPSPVVGDSGPARWLIPFLEARYTRLAEKPSLDPQEAEAFERKADEREQKALEKVAGAKAARPGPLAAAAAVSKNGRPRFLSHLQPGGDEQVLADLPPSYWHDLMQQYRDRQVQTRRDAGARFDQRVDFELGPVAAPGIAGISNWVPVGPSVVRRGQPAGRPAISGRAGGIAVAPGGTRVYAATADGGVWRSDSGGAGWYSTMDNFDVDPTQFAATSLACGAIAIDEADPDRVYVGTGEGDTNALFAARTVFALPAYRGVGPLRSDNGGGSWTVEPTAAGSPPLAGAAFYALAVDPGDRENVVAATNVGLYRREPDGMGGHHWVQKRTGIHSSVVVARMGSTTKFFAAAWGDKVYSSTDGSTWSAAGTSFPAGASRIGLAVRRTDPNVLYALAADASNGPLGVYRLDNAGGAWKTVTGVPPGLFGPSAQYYQGDYDLTITVDPNDSNVVFVGGSFHSLGDVSDGSIYRCVVAASGGAYAMTPTWVGNGVHPDVHVLLFAPNDSTTVFVGCDGGVFRTTTANGASTFKACNTGLGTMSANYLAQHPTEPAVMFCGFQDNGTGRFTGEECWTDVGPGDGGYPVINWNDPYRVLVYWNGSVNRATDGGRDYSSWTDVTPPGAQWFVMAQPLVSAPYNPGSPADAETIAYGAGTALYISNDFGTNWTSVTPVTGGYVYALAFASPTRLFVGTTGGRVFRYDLGGGTWTQTRIDNTAGGPLPLTGLITDVAVDPADATRQSIYLVFGGSGDFRHVWHFDGTAWQARSGPAAGNPASLLDVEHNAIAIDAATAPPTLYVGADIGVWKSSSSPPGAAWTLLENGLPDAAVLDLQLHAPSRRLRAALHGRGVFEYKLDAPAPPDVELYLRDTTLDLGLVPTVDGRNDPATWPIDHTRHWDSPNIKVDVPTPAGWQTPTTQIDFYVFNDKIVDGSQGVASSDASNATVTNRVYVELHNRGIAVAPNVQVMLLLTDASVSLTLPTGYTSNVVGGTPITAYPWQTVGIKTVTNLKVGAPQVVEFNLPSTMLPPPASLPGDSHYCLVAILHAPGVDAFSSTVTSVDALTIGDRKVAQKNLHIVQFVGVSPGAPTPTGWARLMLGGGQQRPPYQLELDLRRFPGRLGLLFPREVMSDALLKKYKPSGLTIVKKWAAEQEKALTALAHAGRFDRKRCAQMSKEIARVRDRPLIFLKGGKEHVLTSLALAKGASQPVFLQITPPANAKQGSSYEFTAVLRGGDKKVVAGGGTVRVDIVRKTHK